MNDPHRIPEIGEASQQRIDQGILVGQYAKKLFSDGIDVPTENFLENIQKTIELLELRKPLFEAGFLVDNIFSRADILYPADEDSWDIIEVKSSTRIKEEFLYDLAFQKLCYERAGLKIRKSFLLYIDNSYIRRGMIEPEFLFRKDDLTILVDDITKTLPGRIDNMLDLIDNYECPELFLGNQCKNCILGESCMEFLPSDNVFYLYRGGKKSMSLFKSGIHAICDIPEDFKLSESQRIQRECLITGQAYVNVKGIKRFLGSLEYPLHFLDFETFSSAIPLYEGISPYRTVPFQFSLHTVDGTTSHFSFLAEGNRDPRPGFLSKLKKVLGDKGSIIVYNQSFEKGVLRALSEVYPEYRDFVESLFPRIVDLLVPFRSFHYYHPEQKGSASIKRVLPALTGENYDGMDIGNGEDASNSFMNIAFGNVNVEEKKKIRNDLEKYCCLDTEGMVWIVEKLFELVS
jgi:hypothetical protein